MIQFTHQDIQIEDLSFRERFGQAMKDGNFYYAMPEDLINKIPSLVTCAQDLHLKKMMSFANYEQNPNTQAATLYSDNWEHLLQDEIRELAGTMNQIAIELLKTTFRYFSVPEEDWGTITQVYNFTSSAFAINHYDPNKKKIGLVPHKDRGWITVLFSNKTGLQKLNKNGSWEDIPPKEGYFVVQFGKASEIFVDSPKLNACIHRVQQVQEERIAFAFQLDVPTNSDIYRLCDGGQSRKLCSNDDYKNICNADFSQLQNT